MTIATQPQSSQLARDVSGRIVECVSIHNWRVQRQNVADTWVLLGDGKPRSAIYIKNNGSETVILAPASTGYSNDTTQATCGMALAAGAAIEPSFGAKLSIYARRVSTGVGTNQLEVVESF